MDKWMDGLFCFTNLFAEYIFVRDHACYTQKSELYSLRGFKRGNQSSAADVEHCCLASATLSRGISFTTLLYKIRLTL